MSCNRISPRYSPSTTGRTVRLDPMFSCPRLAELKKMPKLVAKLGQLLVVAQSQMYTYIVARYNMRTRGLLSSKNRLVFEELFVTVQVGVVFNAFVLPQARAGTKHDRAVLNPGLGEHLRVFHRDLVGNGVFVHTGEFLDHVQLVAMKCACAGQPRFVVEPNGIDD